MNHGKYAYRVHKKTLRKAMERENRRRAILFQNFDALKGKLNRPN
jgi:hypothetical protein